MPQDVIELGDTGVSMTSGPAVWFEPEQEGDILAALGSHGFRCHRDDALVAMAAAFGELGWKAARRKYKPPRP